MLILRWTVLLFTLFIIFFRYSVGTNRMYCLYDEINFDTTNYCTGVKVGDDVQISVLIFKGHGFWGWITKLVFTIYFVVGPYNCSTNVLLWFVLFRNIITLIYPIITWTLSWEINQSDFILMFKTQQIDFFSYLLDSIARTIGIT